MRISTTIYVLGYPVEIDGNGVNCDVTVKPNKNASQLQKGLLASLRTAILRNSPASSYSKASRKFGTNCPHIYIVVRRTVELACIVSV